MQVTCKALGEAELLKLICLQAQIREKKWIKVITGSSLDPLCTVILVSGSVLGWALGTTWCVHTAQ